MPKPKPNRSKASLHRGPSCLLVSGRGGLDSVDITVILGAHTQSHVDAPCLPEGERLTWRCRQSRHISIYPDRNTEDVMTLIFHISELPRSTELRALTSNPSNTGELDQGV